jgi:hypothetical protein
MNIPAMQTMDTALSAATDVAEMVADIALAFQLLDEPALKREILSFAGAADGEPTLIRLPSGAGLEVSKDGRVEPSQRDKLTSGQLLNDLVLGSSEIRRLVQQTKPRAVAKAQATLSPLFVPGHLPTRVQFDAFRRWAPLVCMPAYRFVTRAVDELQDWRAAARQEAASGMMGDTVIARYYAMVHTIAHLQLACSATQPTAWLSDMAHSFTWINWTPTTTLVRERTVWLTAAAAKVAVAFGPGVVDPYVEALRRADHPIKIFDAVFALVAIALAYGETLDTVEQELARAAQAPPTVRAGSEFVMFSIQAALEALKTARQGDTEAGEVLNLLNWRPDTSIGLATAPAFRLDPTPPGPAKRNLGFISLPTVLRTPIDLHYPLRSPAPSPLLLKPEEMPETFLRAWGPPQARTLH